MIRSLWHEGNCHSHSSMCFNSCALSFPFHLTVFPFTSDFVWVCGWILVAHKKSGTPSCTSTSSRIRDTKCVLNCRMEQNVLLQYLSSWQVVSFTILVFSLPSVKCNWYYSAIMAWENIQQYHSLTRVTFVLTNACGKRFPLRHIYEGRDRGVGGGWDRGRRQTFCQLALYETIWVQYSTYSWYAHHLQWMYFCTFHFVCIEKSNNRFILWNNERRK